MSNSKHSYVLHTGAGGVITGRAWTNDNLDLGYPSEDANWDVSYKNKESAIKNTGGSHIGVNGCEVEVTLDGQNLRLQREPSHKNSGKP